MPRGWRCERCVPRGWRCERCVPRASRLLGAGLSGPSPSRWHTTSPRNEPSSWYRLCAAESPPPTNRVRARHRIRGHGSGDACPQRSLRARTAGHRARSGGRSGGGLHLPRVGFVSGWILVVPWPPGGRVRGPRAGGRRGVRGVGTEHGSRVARELVSVLRAVPLDLDRLARRRVAPPRAPKRYRMATRVTPSQG